MRKDHILKFSASFQAPFSVAVFLESLGLGWRLCLLFVRALAPSFYPLHTSPSSSLQIVSCRFWILFFASAPARVCGLMFKTSKLRESLEQYSFSLKSGHPAEALRSPPALGEAQGWPSTCRDGRPQGGGIAIPGLRVQHLKPRPPGMQGTDTVNTQTQS